MASLRNRPKNIWKKYHDSNLHNEMPALRKYSNQGKARAAIQVRRLRLEIVISGCRKTNGGKMRQPFDIYTDSPGAQPVWIESAQNLDDARECLREVSRIAPRRDCFICSGDGGIVEIIAHARIFRAPAAH